MSEDSKSRSDRPVDTERLLRPQSRIDLILSTDFITGQADVRSSMILDLSDGFIVASQTDPPIFKSMIDQVIEVTTVHHDLITYEATRWGWTSRIVALKNDYRLNERHPNSQPVAVVYLSSPAKGSLQKANVRQAYRLDLSNRDIKLYLEPLLAPVVLVNFSAGGAMLETPASQAYTLGQEISYSITFPPSENFGEKTIAGKASIIRLEYNPGDKMARIGLKFMDINPNSSRDLQKIINAYMLEEQRQRNRNF